MMKIRRKKKQFENDDTPSRELTLKITSAELVSVTGKASDILTSKTYLTRLD